MNPIHELLSRIRWDAAFAAHRFVIGYWDKAAGKVLHVDLREISRDADNPSFKLARTCRLFFTHTILAWDCWFPAAMPATSRCPVITNCIRATQSACTSHFPIDPARFFAAIIQEMAR